MTKSAAERKFAARRRLANSGNIPETKPSIQHPTPIQQTAKKESSAKSLWNQAKTGLFFTATCLVQPLRASADFVNTYFDNADHTEHYAWNSEETNYSPAIAMPSWIYTVCNATHASAAALGEKLFTTCLNTVYPPSIYTAANTPNNTTSLIQCILDNMPAYCKKENSKITLGVEIFGIIFGILCCCCCFGPKIINKLKTNSSSSLSAEDDLYRFRTLNSINNA